MPGVESVTAGDPRLQVQFVPDRVSIRIENYKDGRVESVAVTRTDINNLIKKLREARDYSYGVDQ